jgi:hypothetical protein
MPCGSCTSTLPGPQSFQLVNARYEKGAMILTSNHGFSEWEHVFGDPQKRMSRRRRQLRLALATFGLVTGYFVGGRDGECAKWFIEDDAQRLSNRVQLTSDGHKAYLEAVEGAFGADIDYAQLVKLYGASSESAKGRYSPADCTGIIKNPIEGKPDPAHISTSYIERQNLTMRMHMRRFTRLTNAFPKKVENHAYAVALHMMYYNFVIRSCGRRQQWPLA